MSKKFEYGAPLPKTIGGCADLYAEVRDLRLAMQKETDAVRKRESEIREHIIDNLSKSDDTGAAGKRYRAQVKVKATAKIGDWNKLTSWMAENDRFDLVQKRVNERAVKDIWDEDETVPGVERVNVPTVSITKI